MSDYLVTLRFTHYSPKDSEQGIVSYLVTDSLDKVMPYVDKTHAYGGYHNRFNDCDEGEFTPLDDVVNEMVEKATSLGLHIDKSSSWVDISGDWHLVTRCFGGEDWKDVEDAFYGVTHYHWREHREISDDHAEILRDLGIAIDISEFPTFDEYFAEPLKEAADD